MRELSPAGLLIKCPWWSGPQELDLWVSKTTKTITCYLLRCELGNLMQQVEKFKTHMGDEQPSPWLSRLTVYMCIFALSFILFVYMNLIWSELCKCKV